jgi:NitT/TauT family transport system substrate-binding protein
VALVARPAATTTTPASATRGRRGGDHRAARPRPGRRRGDAPTPPPPASPATLRLGYFPNVTHAPAILGVEDGLFPKALGPNVTLELSTFNAGTDVITALFSGRPRRQLHRPQPGDQRLRQVRRRRPAHRRRHDVGRRLARRQRGHHRRQLQGTTLSTPSLGNTQDVALRPWLQGRRASTPTPAAAATSRSPRRRTPTR